MTIMTIPGWHLVRLLAEAASELIGGVVDNIRHDPVTGRMVFTLGSHRGKRYVVVGVRGDRQGLFWVHKKDEFAGFDSFQPTERFNRLKGARLAAVDLPKADRILRAGFVRPDGATPCEVALWVGWIGKSGNMWLVDSANDMVLETQWRTTDDVTGMQFVSPKPPALMDWRTITFPEYLHEREQRPQDRLADCVRRRFWGIDTMMASLIQQEYDGGARGASVSDPTNAQWQEFSAIVGVLRRAVDPGTPIELIPAGNGLDGAAEAAPHQIGSENKTYPSLASALAERDKMVQEQSGRESRADQLAATIDKQLKKALRRLADTQRAVESAGQAEALQHQADILGLQRHLLCRGMAEVTVADWKTGATVTIPLDKKLSPQENIEEYYQRARKTSRAAENAQRTLPEVSREVERLRRLREELEGDGVTEERLDAIGTEMGVAAPSQRPPKQMQPPRLAYREFTINDYAILVGRSNRENDEVTFRVARPDDLFLHANQASGSHVILRSRGRGLEFPAEIITVAAQMAAYFSKARHSGLVSVIYTPVRHVTKPRKAPPGLVRVQREKSVMVRPLPPPGYHDSDRTI